MSNAERMPIDAPGHRYCMPANDPRLLGRWAASKDGVNNEMNTYGTFMKIICTYVRKFVFLMTKRYDILLQRQRTGALETYACFFGVSVYVADKGGFKPKMLMLSVLVEFELLMCNVGNFRAKRENGRSCAFQKFPQRYYTVQTLSPNTPASAQMLS